MLDLHHLEVALSQLTSLVWLLIVVSPAQRGWDSYIVYLFDKSITKYSGPFSARQLPDKVNTIGQFTSIQDAGRLEN